MRFRNFGAAAIGTLLLAGVLAGCSSSASSDNTTSKSIDKYDSSSSTLNLVVGSEQQSVMDQIVVPWCTSQHLTCNFDKLGSVDQARLLQSGDANAVPYDGFWFASSVFQQLGDTHNLLQPVQPMFLTPVVFAGWKSDMQKLGFVGRPANNPVTIQQVLQALESKQTSTWVTNPTQSNSGATTFLSYLNYFAGNDVNTQLTLDQLDSPAVQQGITEFVRSFDQTPPSSGTLMDDCVADHNGGGNACQTVFTYEDLVIQYNQQQAKAGKDTMYTVYPQGSLAISDAPLGFLPHGSNPAKLANFQKLQNYLLKDPGAQEQLLKLGRRPANISGLALTGAPQDAFNPAWGIQTTITEQSISYPKAPVIQAALDNYQTSYRNPVDAVYCIDGSGSMSKNGGWEGVDRSSELLFDPDKAKQYLLQVNPEDRTTVAVFDDGIKQDSDHKGPWTVTGSDTSSLLNDIKNQDPDGGTGLFNCLNTAVDQLKPVMNDGHKHLIVLMTDGNADPDDANRADSVLASVKSIGVPVIAIGFGNDADGDTLGNIAKQTGGTYIKAGNDLVGALRSATGYK